MTWQHLKRPIGALPHLSAATPRLSLSQCQCWPGWTLMVPNLGRWNIKYQWVERFKEYWWKKRSKKLSQEGGMSNRQNIKQREQNSWTINNSYSTVLMIEFVGCLTSQQHASVSQGRICTDNFTCYHTEIEVADQTFYLTQSLYTDTGPTSPSADPIMPGTWQGSHWGANF